MRLSNKNVRDYVTDRGSFKANNLFAEWNKEEAYIVYSYGYHFPIYAYKNGIWYANKNKYSISTSRHQTQVKPEGVDFVYLDTEGMKAL